MIISVKIKSLPHFSFITLKHVTNKDSCIFNIFKKRVYNTIMLDFCLFHF